MSYHETSYVGTGHAIQAKHYCVAPVVPCVRDTALCCVKCTGKTRSNSQQESTDPTQVQTGSLYFLIVLITKLRHSVNVSVGCFAINMFFLQIDKVIFKDGVQFRSLEGAQGTAPPHAVAVCAGGVCYVL